jgi:hypothetical protein
MERCIRCEGELEIGFLIDKGGAPVVSQAQWASGNPNTSFWRISDVQSGSQILPVVTYRCKSCGRLESFAPTAA